MTIQLPFKLAIAGGIDSIGIAFITVIANIIRGNNNWINLITVDAFTIAVVIATIEVVAVVITALYTLSRKAKQRVKLKKKVIMMMKGEEKMVRKIKNLF